ncbi:MAG TPA: hypothetical protein VF234_03930, partial [Limnochordia bacterium]
MVQLHSEYVLENEAVRVSLHPESLRGEVRLKGCEAVWQLDLRRGGWRIRSESEQGADGSRRGPGDGWEELPPARPVRQTADELVLYFERGGARQRTSVRL